MFIIKVEVSAGGLVYQPSGDHSYRVLMILDRAGRWTFPKGGIENGETPEDAALREIEEETGVIGILKGKLGEAKYTYSLNQETVDKTVHYFLVEYQKGSLKPLLAEVKDARWLPLEEVWKYNGYEDNLPIIEAAVSRLA